MRGNGKDTAPPPAAGTNPLGELFQVKPADVLDFWMEGPRVISTHYACREQFEGQAYDWVWMFLDDGSLVEASPDGFFRYREHLLVKQGTAEYEEIVAQDGALVRFEERVREETSHERPVEFLVDGRSFRVASTGTVAVRRTGEEAALLPWKFFNAEQRNNVYFGLEDPADEDVAAVGLWTAHVCISVGKALEPADITAIYRK